MINWFRKPPPDPRIAILCGRINEFGHKLDAGFRLQVQTSRKVDEMDAAISDLAAVVDAYAKKVDAYIANQKADVQKAIDDAIAKDDAEEAVDLNALKQSVMDAMNRVPPTFEPSANG